MNKSENISELCKAMNIAQPQIKAAIKDSTNPFFRSKYADLQAVWDSCREALHKQGLSVIQMPTHIDGEVALETILTHSSGQWISGEYPLNPIKKDPQGVGAAITYARRYALAAVVGVVYDDDDDGETATGRGAKVDTNGREQKKKPKWTDEQKAEAGAIRSELIELGADKLAVALWNKCGYDAPSDVIDKLNELLKQQRDIADQASQGA